MKLVSTKPLLIWLAVAVCVGVGTSFIPWGTPTTFHGSGMPMFVVAWDRSPDTGQFIDFPNALGFVINPLLIFTAGFLLWCVCWLGYVLLRRIRAA